MSLGSPEIRTRAIPLQLFWRTVSQSIWAQYTVQVESPEKRNEIFNRFKENGIPYSVFYPLPLHMQTAYKDFCINADDMTKSEFAAERVFSIPMHPYLEEKDQERIASLIY